MENAATKQITAVMQSWIEQIDGKIQSIMNAPGQTMVTKLPNNGVTLSSFPDSRRLAAREFRRLVKENYEEVMRLTSGNPIASRNLIEILATLYDGSTEFRNSSIRNLLHSHISLALLYAGFIQVGKYKWRTVNYKADTALDAESDAQLEKLTKHKSSLEGVISFFEEMQNDPNYLKQDRNVDVFEDNEDDGETMDVLQHRMKPTGLSDVSVFDLAERFSGTARRSTKV